MKHNTLSYKLVAVLLTGVTGFAFAADDTPAQQTDRSGGPINFEGNVINAPCVIKGTSKSQTVSLGDATVKQLNTGKSEARNFTIGLEGCDLTGQTASGGTAANYSKAKIVFNGEKANAAGDILKLTAVDGAAQNVGVQITEQGSTTPLVLETGYTAEKALQSGVSSYDFPFSAYYIKNGGSPVAGKANATVNFTVVYE